ncbi:TPA: hypothetical protein QDZ99_002997 [Stenotrophomonas maltophilia]|uniref:hypothetical protein n=1 Tax=Stenotrophomonas maltophilia TaxID=40324 RepID=UPI00200C9945|nr:hypothetical protein [Stenotrophomonas maltophilia]ELF4101852.1 hypothetical protein [Stenotrophomonas maltophilia]UQA68864.1 hypothetical protein K1516_12970 [Stenotrophomonas maltophilia]WQI19351.1 hypothetical protein U2S91_14485 [Stenotrophomonas maltophilia]HDS1131058.1 hypothetical protein [Stenotrophomonas maltophilia]HDS1157239.1 hypothetical protein [Stenotrophomonas maltophilia]
MRSALQMQFRSWPVQTRCDAVATARWMAGETPDWNECVEETGNVSHCRLDSPAFDFEMVKTIGQYGQVESSVEHTAAFCMHIRTQFHTSTAVEVPWMERSPADTLSSVSSRMKA